MSFTKSFAIVSKFFGELENLFSKKVLEINFSG